MYIAGFRSKEEKERVAEIHYWVCRDAFGLSVECGVEGTSVKVSVPLKTKDPHKAEEIAAFLAEKSVHPYHLEDILSDLCL